jgi:tight adherence protein B
MNLAAGYMLYLIAGVIAVGTFVFFLLVRFVWDARSRRMRERLQMVRSGEEHVILRPREPQGRIARLDNAFDNLIEQTGLELAPDQAVGWMILVGCVLGCIAYVLTSELWLGAAGLLVGAAGVLAIFFIYRLIHRRRLQQQLPDAISLLARALRSGLSLEQAISLAASDSPAPLAGEFKKCDAQVKLGMSVPTALETMAKRLQNIDVHGLVAAVAVFQTSGGDLPVLLDRLAASARDRANLRAHFRAATALSRISIIPLTLLVPVLVIVYLVSPPSYAESFMNSPAAPLVIGGAILAECVGLYWIYRLLRFDY